MDEKTDISSQIRDICTYANLAVRQGLREQTAYQQYVRAFKTLLRSHVSRMDADNQSAIDEMISVIFIVYDDMLDSPEQESSQAKKLAEYIETLLVKIKQDASYLQHWSMQACIDALLQTKHLDSEPTVVSSESLEEFVENSMKELDDLLLLEQQKSSLLRENDLINDDDDDQLSQEMEKILNLSATDMYAEKHPTHPYVLDSDTESVSTQTDKDQPFARTRGDSDTTSYTTQADEFSEDDISLSDHSGSEDRSSILEAGVHTSDDALSVLASFSDKFNKLITQFHGQSLDPKLEHQDRVILEKTIDRVACFLFDAYKQCFKQGVTEENLTEFDQLSKSLTNNWSHWNEKHASKSSTSSVDQAVTKLNMSLVKLTNEMRQNLPDEPRQASFKDLS